MSRWNIFDPNRVHTAEPRIPQEGPVSQENGSDPSVGRAGNGDQDSVTKTKHPERSVGSEQRGAHERRSKHEDQGQTYSLRNSEMVAMTDIGRFRVVDVEDLARFAYRGDETRMKYDIENLRKQGLVEEKTVFKTHKPTRKMITLTLQGHRLMDRAGGLAGQKIYHGIVKPKELDHDADLYKVYQKAAKEIELQGGKSIRVKLDFELKESINRAREAANHLPQGMRESFLRAVAEEQGLTIDGVKIHLPDLQVEYTTPGGRLERENLELLSRNYREAGIRGKASAGFKLYARSGDTNRVRRALHDTGMVGKVLSL